MKFLKKYNTFLLENNNIDEFVELVADVNILESIVTDTDMLLKSIEAKEVDIFKTFELNPDNFKNNFTIERLYKSKSFNKSLNKKNMKKSTLEETDDSETFIENTYNIKFFLIHDINKLSIDNPNYIVYQSKKKVDNKWDSVRMYEVNGDIKNFYDKLSNKTIELKKDDKVYIYFTSNSGNNWQLQNIEQSNDIFLDILDREQIKMILKDKDISITIIA